MGLSPIRVLIVDDDPHARRLHATYLNSIEGFLLVDAVGTGEAAIGVAGGADIDLVLLDINLPGFSGVEVLHRLREMRGGAVDVWVISAARDRQTVRQAVAARIVGFLVKPFTRDVFVERLSAYRDNRQAADRLPPESEVPLGQGEIDDLVSMLGRGDRTAASHRTPRAAATFSESLPKGIAASTLTAVREALDPWRPMTAAEVARATGASRATVRRYLDHLVHSADVDVSHRFGKRGRPEVLYRLAALPD